jgi:hypothetical protein
LNDKRPKSREETPKEGSDNAKRYRTATICGRAAQNARVFLSIPMQKNIGGVALNATQAGFSFEMSIGSSKSLINRKFPSVFRFRFRLAPLDRKPAGLRNRCSPNDIQDARSPFHLRMRGRRL